MHRRLTLLSSISLLLVLVCGASAEPRVASELELKAAYLFNFIKYVEFPEKLTHINICLHSAEAEFESQLFAFVRAKSASDSVSVVKLSGAREIHNCHVLFLGGENDPATAELIHKARELPILSVGENEQFCNEGGIVRLYRDGTQIRFEINLAQARKNFLVISSKLLQLAKICAQ